MERDSKGWGTVTKDMIGKKFVGTRTRDSFPMVETPEMEVLAFTEDGSRVKIRLHTGLFAGTEDWFKVEQIGIGDFVKELEDKVKIEKRGRLVIRKKS